jgi:hypothetical protein
MATAEGQAKAAQFGVEAAKLKSETTRSMANKTVTTMMNPDAEEAKANARIAAKAGAGDQEIVDPWTGKVVAQGRNKFDTNKANDRLLAAKNLKDGVDELQAFYDKHKGIQLMPGNRDELDQLHKMVTARMQTFNGQTGSDFKIKFDERMLPTAGNILSLNQDPTRQMNNIRKDIDNAVKTVIVGHKGSATSVDIGATDKSSGSNAEKTPAPKMAKEDELYLKSTIAKDPKSPEAARARKLLGL